VQFLGAFHQAEAPTKLAVKRFSVIAHHFKPAAFRRAFWSKGADNHVATAFNSAGNLLNVGKASLCCRKKMEYRSVMPEIVGMWFQLDFKDIPYQPTHLLCTRTQSLFVTSIAVRETSNTVRFLYPRRRRSSTSVDSPPPMSMMEDERATSARSISARMLPGARDTS